MRFFFFVCSKRHFMNIVTNLLKLVQDPKLSILWNRTGNFDTLVIFTVDISGTKMWDLTQA